MREYMIGAATGDAHRIVQSYIDGDMLLPGADVDRLEEMTEEMLRRFGDSLLGQAQNIDFFEYNSFIMNEYRDLIENPPIQFQVELLFVLRAVSLVSGMTAKLSPSFDPQTQAMPVIRQLLQDEVRDNRRDWARELTDYGRIALRMPKQVDRLLTQAQRQKLTVQTKPSPEARKEMKRLRQSISRLTWIVAAVGLFLGGVLWRVGDTIGDALSGVARTHGLADLSSLLIIAGGIVFLVSMRKGR